MDRTDPSKRQEVFDTAYGQRAIQSWRSLLVSALEASAPGAILLLVYFSVAIPLHLFANVPLHDDWTYAWSVEHFLKTGKLQSLTGRFTILLPKFSGARCFVYLLGFHFRR